MKIGFGIPTLNRYDLLREALELYKYNFASRPFYILDNGTQYIPYSHSYELLISERNLGVASSWNYLLNKLFEKECTHACILNDDVIWKKNAFEIEAFLKENPSNLWLGKEHGFTIFAITRDCFEYIGPFDKIFWPAYYEDNDYMQRLCVENQAFMHTEFFDADVFRTSQTLAKDPRLERNYENLQLYIDKWGGGPGAEIYRTPYNLCGAEQ